MLRRQAAVWLARLEGGRDPELEHEFRRWHEADPAHAEAFERVRRSYESAGLLRRSELARDCTLHTRAEPRPQPRWALAGAIALVVLIPGAILVADRGVLPLGAQNTVLLASAIGEIRRVTLQDGSTVTLDTSTAVEVEIGRSERRAVLRKGRARFEVAPDRRPFIVEAGAATVTSGSAVLDVERRGVGARVEVLSGSAAAAVNSDGQTSSSVTIGAGQGFSSEQPAPYRLSADRMAWTSGMLQFDGTPLGEVVASANRYSARKIILAPEINQLRVTGAFRAGDVAGLARSLAEAFGLKLERTRNGDFLLAPRPDAPLKKNGG